MVTKLKQNGLWLYYALALALTWACWIPALIAAGSFGMTLPLPFPRRMQGSFFDPTHPAVDIIFSLGVYGPLVAAVAVTALESGREGLRALFRKMTRLQIGGRWWAALLAIPVLIHLIPALLSNLLGFGRPTFLQTGAFRYLLPMALHQLLTSGLEEPGWRGYALPKLQETHNAEDASWKLGLMWAIWHYPLMVALYWPMGFAMLPTLAGFTMGIIGQTIVFTWLVNNTKSIAPAIIFHAWLNITSTYLIGTTQNPMLAFLPVLLTWVLAVVLTKRYGKETLTGVEREAV